MDHEKEVVVVSVGDNKCPNCKGSGIGELTVADRYMNHAGDQVYPKCQTCHGYGEVEWVDTMPSDKLKRQLKDVEADTRRIKIAMDTSSDLDTLKAMLDRADIKYKEKDGEFFDRWALDEVRKIRTYAHTVLEVKQGMGNNLGYSGFFTYFFFDEHGRLLAMGAWE